MLAMVARTADTHRLRISASAGRVTVTAEARDDLLVERGGAPQAAADGTVEVGATRFADSVVVHCPSGTDVMIGTHSGRVDLRGQFGSVGITSLSGSMRVEAVTAADLRTVSGSVEVEQCAGRCRISTKSGRITVGSTGDAELSTISGRMRVGGVSGAAQLRSVSGVVEVASAGHGPLQVGTVSGKITISLPAGVRPHVRSTGLVRLKNTFEPGDDVLVDVAAISGSVRLVAG
jgi:hypothetical protein